MHVLHICNDFFSSKVHANLYRELDNLDVEQSVYATCTVAELFGHNEFNSKHTKFIHGLLQFVLDEYISFKSGIIVISTSFFFFLLIFILQN